MKRVNVGFSLIELLVTVTVLATIASVAWVNAGADRDRLQLDAAARRFQLGLERARTAARRAQRSCGISLGPDAWRPPDQRFLSRDLPPCSGVPFLLQEEIEQGPIRIQTNLPKLIRVSANGLILDGGTTVLSHKRLTRGRCLVVSLPLGVSRVGLYRGDLPSFGEAPRSRLCRPMAQES